nr:unnamed protein product [Digitaria exilis]
MEEAAAKAEGGSAAAPVAATGATWRRVLRTTAGYSAAETAEKSPAPRTKKRALSSRSQRMSSGSCRPWEPSSFSAAASGGGGVESRRSMASPPCRRGERAAPSGGGGGG